MIKQPYRPGVGLHALRTQHYGKEFVLTIAEAADGLCIGTVAGIAVRQLNAPRCEERTNAVVPRLAVDVAEVVAREVRLINAAGGQEVGKELLPRPHVHLSGRGKHAVQIEQRGVVLMPIHTMKIRASGAPLPDNGQLRSPTAEPRS